MTLVRSEWPTVEHDSSDDRNGSAYIVRQKPQDTMDLYITSWMSDT